MKKHFSPYPSSRMISGFRGYAERHYIMRFGRFPHGNEVLRRESTPEEIKFLNEPGSSF
ncbi:MAG: DUF924 family protein [Ignavibacteriales bacterium]